MGHLAGYVAEFDDPFNCSNFRLDGYPVAVKLRRLGGEEISNA